MTNALEKNSMLDCSPSKIYDGQTAEKIMNLRPRNIKKEIGPPCFKYKATSTLEKVAEILYNNPPL